MLNRAHNLDSLWGKYQQLEVVHDTERQTAWGFMKASPLPCWSPVLVKESLDFINQIGRDPNIKYMVAASAREKIFNIGGDLETFIKYIEAKDSEALRSYAYDTVKLGHACVHQLYNDVTTIALVQGETIGGGWEAALSCNVLIAEDLPVEEASFVFPEILFNMFPAMGAYTFLSMRVPPSEAHKIISSGNKYSARELFDMGVIDILAPAGQGQDAVNQYIDEHSSRHRGLTARHKARLLHHPVTMEELEGIVDIWVENAMATPQEDLSIMKRLLKAQTRRYKVKS